MAISFIYACNKIYSLSVILKYDSKAIAEMTI